MHKNSFAARRELIKSGKKKTREQMIFEVYYFHGKHTDRGVLRRVKPGSDDMNYVRPRISEMIADKILTEDGTAVEFGEPVRIVDIDWPLKEKQQTTLL